MLALMGGGKERVIQGRIMRCVIVYVHLCKERERTKERVDLATSTTLLGLNSSTLTHSNSWLGLLLLHSATNLVLDLLSHCQESLFNIGGILGRSLQEWYAQWISKFLEQRFKLITRKKNQPKWYYLCLIGLDHLLIDHIALVAYQQLAHTFSSISFNLLHPLLDVVERILICHIVDNNDTMGASVVRRGDSTETFLASCIPLE